MTVLTRLARWWRGPVAPVAPPAPDPIVAPPEATAQLTIEGLAAVIVAEPEPLTAAPAVNEPVVAPDVSAQGMVFVTGIVRPPVGSAWVTPLNARPHQVRRPHEGDA